MDAWLAVDVQHKPGVGDALAAVRPTKTGANKVVS
jgi:hypothetical protein